MRSFTWSVVLLATWLGQDVAAQRVLRAATRRGDLYRRSVRIAKRYEVEVGYVQEENGWAGVETFAAQVKVGSKMPILNLEEVEHHLEDVRCDEGKIEMSFVDKVAARDAYYACHEKSGGLVVTSHDSCNKEGERAVYRVHNVQFTHEGEALELSVSEESWQDAFDRFDISFGHTTDDHLFRRHSDFAKIRKKRQAFDIAIPADTPDTVNSAVFDLKSELIDTVFSAESFLLGLEELVPIPQLPIEIGCKNCSTRGQIALTQGAFQIDPSQIDLIPDIFQGGDDGKEITSVISGGFIELSATGVGAHLELFARPKASGAFEVTLTPLPILGFVIPGVGRAGAVFEPRIAADFDISGGFELTYGIDVAVPDNSNIRLELTNIANSGVNGFPGSTLTPLPFTANITDLEILLGLAFKPTIPVGFEFLDKLNAEVSVSMNLPRLDAKLTTNPAANCGNSSNSTLPSAPFANQTSQVAGDLLALGSLVLVEANISLTIDASVGLSFPLLPPPFNDVGIDANIFSTVFPLVTACVDAGKSLPLMTATMGGNATSTPAASNSTTYITATTTKTQTMTHTSVAHSNTTQSSGHVVASSHAILSSQVAATSHVVASSHVLATSHAIPSTHIIQPSSAPATSAIPSTHIAPTTSTSDSPSLAISSLLPPAISFSPAPPLSFAPPPFPSSSQNTTITPGLMTTLERPAVTVVMSSGFLGNVSGIPVQQTGAAVFTGAAVVTEVPGVRWRTVGWQVGIVGVSLVLGAGVMVM